MVFGQNLKILIPAKKGCHQKGYLMHIHSFSPSLPSPPSHRHQFPPTPTRQGSLPGGGASGGGGIPSWQRVTPAAKTDQTGLPNGTPEKPLEEQTNGGSGAESSSSPEGEKVRGKKASNGGPPPVPVVGKLNSSDEENMQEWHDAPN